MFYHSAIARDSAKQYFTYFLNQRLCTEYLNQMSVNLYLVAANKYMSENRRSVIDVVSGNNVKDTSSVAKHNCLFLGVNMVVAIVTNNRRVADVPAAL